MAVSISITAKGVSGFDYRFHLYPIGTSFKPLPGVYVFLKGGDPVYVGETADLSERFDNHHKAMAIRRHGANQIGVLVESNGERRLAIERDLLGGYHWPCNG